ncbi:hypothetical protein [Clostridium beijerinckii]|uniref:hypothetical protein n=1 Tax=Clostridium beijerinckii TaxID=1520 RepID=UPI001570455A|nr:hypothetical protein [Clostridium beijerinckii]NRU52449.1 hypothetical protein [Clostridium beijerinckii]NYC69106.1 hypothetical protein [Clostridium beijerinckii]NYC91933.1 hypothetical protein [Clostridium beijerinckii]
MNYKTYTKALGQVLEACKSQNINANMKKLQDDIISGVDANCIIKNLYKYI